ncbi:MAG: hypothetical protein ACR2JO_00665 [Mycobacteriales bacterium]
MSATVTAALVVRLTPYQWPGSEGFPPGHQVSLTAAHEVERAVIGLPETARVIVDIGDAVIVSERHGAIIADRLAHFRAVEVVGTRPAGVVAMVAALRQACARVDQAPAA